MSKRLRAVVGAVIIGIVLAVGTTVGDAHSVTEPPAGADVRADGGFVPLCPNCLED